MLLQKIIASKGFSISFDKMIDYTVNTYKEAGIRCLASKEDFVFSLEFGNYERIAESYDDLYLDSNGKKIRTSRRLARFNKRVLSLHTHPYVGELDGRFRNVFDFSSGDINVFSTKMNTVNGIVVFNWDNANRASSLLWKPFKRYDYYKDRRRIFCDLGQGYSALRKYGKAERIDFELRDRKWKPIADHLSRLATFE